MCICIRGFRHNNYVLSYRLVSFSSNLAASAGLLGSRVHFGRPAESFTTNFPSRISVVYPAGSRAFIASNDPCVSVAFATIASSTFCHSASRFPSDFGLSFLASSSETPVRTTFFIRLSSSAGTFALFSHFAANFAFISASLAFSASSSA